MANSVPPLPGGGFFLKTEKKNRTLKTEPCELVTNKRKGTLEFQWTPHWIDLKKKKKAKLPRGLPALDSQSNGRGQYLTWPSCWLSGAGHNFPTGTLATFFMFS